MTSVCQPGHPQSQDAPPDIWGDLEAVAPVVDEAMRRYLPPADTRASELRRAMEYALVGGKRLRPYVVMQAAATFGADERSVIPAGCAFEMFHVASLIHDDLPLIDNSDLRRGRPSCHVAFGEVTALLAGDALIIAAFSALADQANVPDIDPATVARAVSEFAAVTGATGVIAGEAVDIEAEKLPVDADLLAFIHLNKTARLFVGAARVGAILAGAPQDGVDLIGEYARVVGLLFQVTDDILDVTGDEAALGKPVGADAAVGKQTYPALLGLDGAKQYAAELAAQASTLANRLPSRQGVWLALAEMFTSRRS
jgi:geranylgeranyl diphosphate synthase type II